MKKKKLNNYLNFEQDIFQLEKYFLGLLCPVFHD